MGARQRSVDYLKSLNDSRIKIIIDSDLKGVMESGKKGVFEEKEILSLLDSDDIWMKTKLEEQIDFMKRMNTYFRMQIFQLMTIR